jgi:hypothetical protein
VIVNAKKTPQTGVSVKRSYNKVYHFDEINQFSDREIPEQSEGGGEGGLKNISFSIKFFE